MTPAERIAAVWDKLLLATPQEREHFSAAVCGCFQGSFGVNSIHRRRYSAGQIATLFEKALFSVARLHIDGGGI